MRFWGGGSIVFYFGINKRVASFIEHVLIIPPNSNKFLSKKKIGGGFLGNTQNRSVCKKDTNKYGGESHPRAWDCGRRNKNSRGGNTRHTEKCDGIL